MSSPVDIIRPASSASSSLDSSYTSTSSSSSSASLRTGALVYSREELLLLATSPLAHSPAPTHLHVFPEIMRKTRRGLLEAFQTLEYSRLTSPVPKSPRNYGSSHLQEGAAPVWRTDVYVPPARRTPSPGEQRTRSNREPKMRSWKRTGPVPTRRRWDADSLRGELITHIPGSNSV